MLVAKYHPDPSVSLRELRSEVFARGDYRGAEHAPRTPEEALELSGETGTRSILDIQRVSDEPDFFCAAPLTDEEGNDLLGTLEPTVEDIEGCDGIWEIVERGQCRFLAAYTDGKPTHWVFLGYSFD